jgi:hypothetical protein
MTSLEIQLFLLAMQFWEDVSTNIWCGTGGQVWGQYGSRLSSDAPDGSAVDAKETGDIAAAAPGGEHAERDDVDAAIAVTEYSIARHGGAAAFVRIPRPSPGGRAGFNGVCSQSISREMVAVRVSMRP